MRNWKICSDLFSAATAGENKEREASRWVRWTRSYCSLDEVKPQTCHQGKQHLISYYCWKTTGRAASQALITAQSSGENQDANIMSHQLYMLPAYLLSPMSHVIPWEVPDYNIPLFAWFCDCGRPQVHWDCYNGKGSNPPNMSDSTNHWLNQPLQSVLRALPPPAQPPSAGFSSSNLFSYLWCFWLVYETGITKKQMLPLHYHVHLHIILHTACKFNTAANSCICSVVYCMNQCWVLIGNSLKNWAINNKHNCICTLLQ